jgi:2-polyprenyl-6-hydroxyphenyl methylase/3-demethylubiquinone-9 3-methyltransferase
MSHNLHNVDREETQHFADMADEWWDPKGPCRPLHDLNPVRVQFITDRVHVKGKKILDVGCGAGILTESLARRHGILTGIDATEKLIEVAKQHAKKTGTETRTQAQSQVQTQIQSQTQTQIEFQYPIQYHYATAEEFAEKQAGEFDIITCLELLEHVPDPESLIHACRTLLKPEGDLFISTINRNPKSYLMAIVGAEYLLKILPKNTHHYEKFIQPSELEAALRKANFKMQDIAGLHYNPFTHQAKLTQDVSVNYIVHAKASL